MKYVWVVWNAPQCIYNVLSSWPWLKRNKNHQIPLLLSSHWQKNCLSCFASLLFIVFHTQNMYLCKKNLTDTSDVLWSNFLTTLQKSEERQLFKLLKYWHFPTSSLLTFHSHVLITPSKHWTKNSWYTNQNNQLTSHWGMEKYVCYVHNYQVFVSYNCCQFHLKGQVNNCLGIIWQRGINTSGRLQTSQELLLDFHTKWLCLKHQRCSENSV